MKQDNTNWRAGRARGPCFQMKNVNFRQAAQKTEGRAAQKGGPAGCEKWRGGLQKRAALRPAHFGSPASCPARRLALICSPLARPVVQPAGPPFCAARQSAENSCFSFGNMALQPASPPFTVIHEASNSKLLLIGQGMQTAFFNKSNKIKRADQISATVV